MKRNFYPFEQLQSFKTRIRFLLFRKFYKLLLLSFIILTFAGFGIVSPQSDYPKELQSNNVLEVGTQNIVSKIEIDEFLSSNNSQQVISPKGTNSQQAFEQILASLQKNSPQVYTVNLSHEILDLEKIQRLKEVVDNNSIIGYIQWGEIPADCEEIKAQIEEKLVSNILGYTYYPTDYIHGLLSYHVYKNPKLGQKVNLTVVSKEVGHRLPASIHTTWKVAQVKDDSKQTGYYSALYINETTHQAVLAFQGTKVEGLKDLVRKNSDLREDIDGVLGNAITQQNALAYVATKEAVDYTKEKEYNLSITGHSLGGYLAELSVAFCYRDFGYRQVKGIVFDSPGTVNKLDKFKSNVINKATKFSIASLPMVSYLSAPNLINTCNGHPGEVYRVYPQLMWSEEIKKWIKRAKNVPVIGTKMKSMDKGLLAVTGHSLATILKMFDPTTGKPSTYIRIADWPKIDTDNVAYIGKQKQELEKKSFLGSAFSIITGKTNIIGGAFEILPSLIGGTTASVLSVLKDYLNINQTQYWTTLAYLDENYKETNLHAEKEFNLRYQGHYRVSDRAMNEHVLYVENYEGVDWYLYKLYKYKDNLEQSPTKDITFAVLQKILKDYEVVSLDDHPYMRLANQETRVEVLRDRMQRCIKILSTISIKKAIEESTIYVLTKQLEKRSIQQFTQLHTYIAQAKSSTYLLREDKQQELIQKLTKEGICVVAGHGGVGKSTLVAQYGHNQKDKQLVWWMPAETPEKLLKSYQDLAQELGIDYKKLAEEYKQSNDQYLSELSRKVYNALVERKQPVLLILDNAADASLVASCLLHRPDLVQVIITTRKAKEFSAYSQVTLAAFKKEEGERFIKKYFETRLYQPSQQELAALIEEVGLIPQKLALAVGYIGQKRLMAVQGYINKLREIKQSGKQGDKQFVLPEVSLGLESLELQPQLVMRYGAYLDPDFIPLSLISALIEVKDEEELENILDKLEGLSLITIIKGEGSELGIQIHREVQAASKQYRGWINANSLTEEEVLLAIIKVLHERMPKVTEVPDSTWDQAKIYAANVAHVLGHIQEEFKLTPLLADLISRLGNYNQQVERNFEQALKYNQQALIIRQSLYPNNNAAVAASFSNLGGLYRELGNYKEALSYYQQAYEIQKHLYKDNHPSIATSLSSIGDTYNILGQNQEALKYLKQALEMEKHLYTGNHPSVASLFNSLGNVYQALGKSKKALKYYEKALEMIKTLHIGNHPSTAVYLNNLGLLYKRLEQYQEALKYLEQALEMQQKLYTGNHPSIATSLYNLGGCYHVLGQYQEALKCYQQALKMFKALYLNNHPFVAVTLSNIGNVYEALGDYQEALKYDQQALEIMKVLYTDNHINIAVTLSNIGGVYQSLGDHQEALKYYQDALEMMKKLYTGNHFDIAISVNNVGNAYKSLGKYEEALTYYHQSLEMLKILFVGDHSDIAIVLSNIGNAYKALGDYKEALKYHQESLAMKRVLYTGNHAEITISLNNIGDIYQELGDYKEALKYHQEALAMNRVIYIGNHIEIAISLNNIGTSYKALGEYKEALKYHQQALEMMKTLYTGNHFYIAISFNNIGTVYKALGEYKEALEYYQQALAMFQAIYKDNNPNIAISLTNIGAVYQALGEYQEALKYYQKGLEMRQALYSSNHPDIVSSLNKLGDIYKALGDEQQSLKYYQQALEMKQALQVAHSL